MELKHTASRARRNEEIVYQTFKQKEGAALSVYDIAAAVNIDKQILTLRTVYRIVDRLQLKRIIYCSGQKDGTRYFMLCNYYNMELTCHICGWKSKTAVNLKLQYPEHPLSSICIMGGQLVLGGVCQKCSK